MYSLIRKVKSCPLLKDRKKSELQVVLLMLSVDIREYNKIIDHLKGQ